MSEISTRDSSPKSRGPEELALLFALEDRALRVRLPRDEARTLTVGRDESCDVVVQDSSVSRTHASIGGGLPPRLMDAKSRNGTRVGDRTLLEGESVRLRSGMTVQFGDITALVQPAHARDPERVVIEPSEAKVLSVRPDKLAARATEAPHAHAGHAFAPPGAIVLAQAMQEAYAMIELLAPSRLPVLILGETGVGKDVYAESVHRVSERVTKPFLRLNCAALPEALLEAELFGYERGAFTGAVQAKAGLFESAHGGTVFLDEVGEMPLATQAKLLRVLESGEVLRIGSLKPQSVDVRFVSATHRELDVLASEGKFRMDLFYRLNGIAVWLPPLRERREEIVPLATAFASRAGNTHPISPGACVRLQTHDWPGNVRELRNVVDRAVLLARGNPIDERVVQIGIPRTGSHAPAAMPSQPPVVIPVASIPAVPGVTQMPSMPGVPGLPAMPPGLSIDEGVAAFERAQIMAALERTNHNRSEAARQLGISRNRLLRKLDEYGVSRARKTDGSDEDDDET